MYIYHFISAFIIDLKNAHKKDYFVCGWKVLKDAHPVYTQDELSCLKQRKC